MVPSTLNEQTRRRPHDFVASWMLRQPWRARPVPWQRRTKHSLVSFAQSLGFCRVWKQSYFSYLLSVSKTNVAVSIQKCLWQVLYSRVRGVRELSRGGRCRIERWSPVWLLLRTGLRHSQCTCWLGFLASEVTSPHSSVQVPLILKCQDSVWGKVIFSEVYFEIQNRNGIQNSADILHVIFS